MLPGISGVELMHKVRAPPEEKQFSLPAPLIKKCAYEFTNAGALAIFDKPVPADFLDVVERGLALCKLFAATVKKLKNAIQDCPIY